MEADKCICHEAIFYYNRIDSNDKVETENDAKRVDEYIGKIS